MFDCASNSALSLDAVCRYVLRISLSRLCPCFSFRPQCRDVSIQRFRILQSCCVEWFSRWLVLRLFPLPCHVVCHTFVLVRAVLDQTGMCRIQRCQFFRLPTSFADLFFVIICFRCQFPLCANISKDISKTQDKLLKHLKDTDQTSYMSKTQ